MRHHDILSFWFGNWPYNQEAVSLKQPHWFNSTAEFDQTIASKFEQDILSAISSNEQPDFMEDVDSMLAHILLLDQFPRNIYRGTAQAFAGDTKALSTTLEMIDKELHLTLPMEACIFACMPLQHSEDLSVQEQSLLVHEGVLQQFGESAKGFVNYASIHHDIVKRFGRFPHRNAVLNRESTLEERKYLEEGGMRFGQ